MLPKNLHIEQIERFHNLIKDIDTKIDTETDEIKKGELARKYYKLTKIWMEIDEFVEFTLKAKLDNI